MREQFPGYFAPTDEEFRELWTTATFAFDANVLLGLYRLTPESRESFFDAIKKMRERVFLPNQSAGEYLKNRLGAISERAKSLVGLKTDADAFVKNLQTRLHEHDIPRGNEIVDAANQAAQKIRDIADSSLRSEPDFVHSDDVLVRLAELFEGCTGSPYSAREREDIYKECERRYSKRVPPGYKDADKPEPERYGDFVIWRQLLDHAASSQKPIIFVTREAKDDWWLKHNGGILSPRPELVHEMKDGAKVKFYMYTVHRFLEFAPKYFDLNVGPTAKAATEFEEIEKKDKQTATENVAVWMNKWVDYESSQITPTYNLTGQHDSSQVPNWFQFKTTPFFETPLLELPSIDTTYLALLPINGAIFNSSKGKWICEITGTTATPSKSRACYQLKLEATNRLWGQRQLALWLSADELRSDSDGRYKAAIYRAISVWLERRETSGALELLP